MGLGKAVTATREPPGRGRVCPLCVEPLRPTSQVGAGHRPQATRADGLSSEGGRLALCGRRLTLPGQRDLSYAPVAGQGLLTTTPAPPLRQQTPTLWEGARRDRGPVLLWARVPASGTCHCSTEPGGGRSPSVPRRREEGAGPPCGTEEVRALECCGAAGSPTRPLTCRAHARRAQGRGVTGEPSGPATASSTPGSLPASKSLSPSPTPLRPEGPLLRTPLEVTSQWEGAAAGDTRAGGRRAGATPSRPGDGHLGSPSCAHPCGLPLPRSLGPQPSSPAALCPLRRAQEV